jgi:hypothetical protein
MVVASLRTISVEEVPMWSTRRLREQDVLADLVIYFYFDNIDPGSGEIDDNVVQFDDDDLLKKAVKIRRTGRSC